MSTDPRQGAAAVEDDTTNAAPGARRLTTPLTRLRQLLAVAVVAAQAADLAAPATLGRGPGFLRRAIREVVPRRDDDRPCGADVEKVNRDIPGSDDVLRTLRALTGEASALVGGAS